MAIDVNQSKYKILYGVVGTQNTGKTTFIEDVVKKTSTRTDPMFRFSSDFGTDYREKIKAEGLKINRNGDERCQNIIFDTLVENAFAAANQNEHKRLILDRTPIDAWAYTKWHNLYGSGSISKETLDSMWSRLIYSVRVFDRIFWIPLSSCKDIKVEKKDQRDTNLEYRKQIDYIMADAIRELQKLGCHNIYSIGGTRDERVDLAIGFEFRDESIKSIHCF